MNSDNFDNFFKEQISSLNHVPVPGSSWNSESGWESVSANLNKPRKKIFYWFSAAATIIIILGVYLLMVRPAQKTQNMLTKTSTDPAPPTIVSDKTNNVKRIEYTVTEQFFTLEDSNIERPSNHSRAESRLPENSIAPVSMIALKSVQLSGFIERNIIQGQNETLAAVMDKPVNKSLNRTYVINEPKKNPSTIPAKKRIFTFRLGSKNKASTHPPKGLLAGL